MESAATLKVPLIADISEATNWYDCKWKLPMGTDLFDNLWNIKIYNLIKIKEVVKKVRPHWQPSKKGEDFEKNSKYYINIISYNIFCKF